LLNKKHRAVVRAAIMGGTAGFANLVGRRQPDEVTENDVLIAPFENTLDHFPPTYFSYFPAIHSPMNLAQN
jgi:hypothetical protein